MTYMALCEDTTCDKYDATNANWFKIDESGKTADGKWAATDLLYASDSIYTFTIPPKLKAGQYIVRHEMCVALFFCVPSHPC